MTDYEKHIQRVLDSAPFQSGEKIRRGDIQKIIGTKCGNTGSRVLHLMTAQGILEKAGKLDYRRKSNTQYWLRRKWV